jgi:acyl-CoA synthetase (AMP-forming)/AMP-acid ligase II
MMLAVVAAGGAVVPFPVFGVEAWRSLQTVEPTHALVVPSHLEMLLAARALHLDTLQRLHYGASPIHPDTLRAVLDALPGTAVEQLYGQTEGSPITLLTHADHVRGVGREPALLLSVGRAVPGVTLSIDDADGSEVGELVARGPHLFATDEGGVLATGDIARMDQHGYVFLVGRRGDKIIRGGENIYPVEVERVLESHPAVAEAAVFPIPDRRLGERLAALIVPVAPDDPPPIQALVAWSRRHLAAFKIPEEWRFATALPRNPTGKLVRRHLHLDDRAQD